MPPMTSSTIPAEVARPANVLLRRDEIRNSRMRNGPSVMSWVRLVAWDNCHSVYWHTIGPGEQTVCDFALPAHLRFSWEEVSRAHGEDPRFRNPPAPGDPHPVTIEVSVRLEAIAIPEAGGGYSIVVPALPGCVTE